MEQVLKEVHPHYHQSSHYRYFLVLTQSCDLVRRTASSACGSRYISIAAVRPVQTAVTRHIESLQFEPVERKLGFCLKERQPKLIQFMERLLNNNEAEYFYLHREPSAGLREDHCAFLLLSIALKAQVHYDTLIQGRVLSLKESFQHKLGYLVGSLYSRVGTEDWCEGERKSVFQELTREPVQDPNLVLWLEKDVHRKVLELLKHVVDPSQEDLRRFIEESYESKAARKKQMLDIIGEVLFGLQLPEDTVRRARSRLENRADFSAMVK